MFMKVYKFIINNYDIFLLFSLSLNINYKVTRYNYGIYLLILNKYFIVSFIYKYSKSNK